MARAPRRVFAAPFVLTLAAGCPSTVDHRTTDPAPVTEPAPPTTPVANPPPTTPPQVEASWKIVVNNDGTCVAAADTQCKPGMPASCNPPRPMPYTCPAGATNEHPLIIRQEADGCVLVTPPPECKPNMMCNPPPAQKVDCPHY
jgi:hypothetical protein